MQPQDYRSLIEFNPAPSDDEYETFDGFAILGVSFRSGHTLAFRHYPESSIGPAYSSVWMREPGGDWRIFSTAPARLSCARYMQPALADQVEIRHKWLDPSTLQVLIPDLRFEWTVTFATSRRSSLISAAAARVPRWLVRGHLGSRFIAVATRPFLRAGTLRLQGAVPNGERFTAYPQAVWNLTESSARIGHFDLGRSLAASPQHALGDFLLPARPLATAGRIAFRSEVVNVSEPMPLAA